MPPKVDHSQMKLGKLPPKIDPRTLQLARYIAPEALPPLPYKRDWSWKASAPWGMMLNGPDPQAASLGVPPDGVGDCTCAACAHAVQVWTANESSEITIPDSAILKEYEAVGGYVPGNASTDNGAVEIDVLNYWRRYGVGGHKIAAYMSVPPKDRALMKQAINLFGGVYVGIALPITAQTQSVWSCTPSTTGAAAPGSWGGHAVWCFSYTAYRVGFVTWGQKKQMSWCFVDRYCLTVDAPILMADNTEKPLADVSVGDKVMGWVKVAGGKRRLVAGTVTARKTWWTAVQKVTLEDGTVVRSTPDHQWFTGRSDNEYRRARSRGGNSSRIGRIVAADSAPWVGGAAWERGYVYGFMSGDGWATRHSRTHEAALKGTITTKVWAHKVGASCKDAEPIERLAGILAKNGIRFHRTVRKDGLFHLEAAHAEGFEFVAVTCAPEDSDGWHAGFLAGIYDAEGSGLSISQYRSVNLAIHGLIQKSLSHFNFEYRAFLKSVNVHGGKRALWRLWRIASPTLLRKLNAYLSRHPGTFVHSMPRVVNIEADGLAEVVTLTTSTGNYIAHGLGSKNCDEAYACLSSQDWVTDGDAPSGFNLTQLQADLAQL